MSFSVIHSLLYVFFAIIVLTKTARQRYFILYIPDYHKLTLVPLYFEHYITWQEHRKTMKKLFSTKEVAEFLGVNTKIIYSLISEKRLPATKITGKWLFPKHLVEQWIEANTLNYPKQENDLQPYRGLLIIAGSNDLLLDKTISLFNSLHSDSIAVFGNLGSMGGLNALRKNLCHIGASHLLQENENEYNFDFAAQELDKIPVIVNFCKRAQGLIVKKGNPKKIKQISDLGKQGITIANRSLGTGTRLLFDKELSKAGVKGEDIDGYYNEVNRHIDMGIEVLAGRIDAGPGIRPVASLLDLDFIPIRWERFDLLMEKERFFDQGVQHFLSILRGKDFSKTAEALPGYDISLSGEVVFQKQGGSSPGSS